MSEGLGTNSTSGAIGSSGQGLGSSTSALVTGTPPLLQNLNAENADLWFFNGAVAALQPGVWETLTETAQRAHRTNYYGDEIGASGGNGACRLFQETASVLDRVLSGGGSACYMKNAPAAVPQSAVTINNAAITDKLNLFSQQAQDVTVRVRAFNMPTGHPDDPGAMYVNIRVFGTDSLEAAGQADAENIYRAQLFFCQSDTAGTAPFPDQGVETFEVNLNTRRFTTSRLSTQQTTQTQVVLDAVTDDSGDLLRYTVDKTQDRTASFIHVWDDHNGSGFRKQEVTITGDNTVLTRAYSVGSGWTSKDLSFAQFTGSSVDTLRFTQGAHRNSGLSDCDGCTPWVSEGAAEYQSTGYVRVATDGNSYYEEIADEDFGGSFYSAPRLDETALVTTLSAYDCGAAVDAEVDMDFEHPDVAEVQQLCDGNRLFHGEAAWRACEAARDREFVFWEIGNQGENHGENPGENQDDK